LIKLKEHLTIEGLLKIANIRATINNGFMPDTLAKLQQLFPLINPVPRPIVDNTTIFHPDWISGFVSGEGCFMVKLKKVQTKNLDYSATLTFQLTQHSRDEQVMLN
jgi:hypothetical protein